MSHFGGSHSDRTNTYSLLVLNVSFRMTADDLYPLFDKYGKVIHIFIPRDRRTGESRGFAFVRYKYQDEAQNAVDRLDGKVVDGREIAVQFAKYGPNSERIEKGRIIEKVSRRQGGSSSRSPQRRYGDGFYRNRDYRRSSLDRHEHDRYHEREIDHIRSMSYSRSPDYDMGHGRRQYSDVRRSRSRLFERSLFSRRNPPPRNQSPDRRKHRWTRTPGTLPQ